MKRKFSPHIFWTEGEEGVIKKHYPTTTTIKDICKLLPGRSKSQIQNHANWMGLVRPVNKGRTAEEIREAKRELMARKRASDPEGARKYSREWHHKNRDANSKRMREYAAKRFFWTKSTHLRSTDRATPQELSRLWKTQRGLCALTGRRLDRTAQLDHILPKCRGGADSIGNLQWLCAEANIAKRHLTDEEFLNLCRDCMRWLGERIQMVAEI